MEASLLMSPVNIVDCSIAFDTSDSLITSAGSVVFTDSPISVLSPSVSDWSVVAPPTPGVVEDSLSDVELLSVVLA